MGIKLKGLNLGYFGMDYNMMVFPHPSYDLGPSRREGPKTWYECPALAYIVEHPDGLILWETGVSANWREDWPQDWQSVVDLSTITPEVCLESRLKDLGLAAEDFKYVVMGHLHTDHTGGLPLFEQAGATVVVHEDEYRYVSQVQTAENFFLRSEWNFLGWRHPTTVYGDQEILKDVRLVSLPGHTPGTMGMLVRLNHTGWVLLTSDALYTHDSYGPPAIPGATVSTWRPDEWFRSVERIRALGSEHDAFVMPGHGETGIQHAKGECLLREIEYLPNHVYE